MDRLKLLITDEDTWTGAEGENEGTPFLIRFRPHLQDFIATQKYNKHLTILWSYESEDSSLMPEESEMELMEDVENNLIDSLENDLQAILTFVYLGQNQKEWHWYSTDLTETGKRINNVLSDFDRLPIELLSSDDPTWSEYNAVIDGAEYSEEDTDDK